MICSIFFFYADESVRRGGLGTETLFLMIRYGESTLVYISSVTWYVMVSPHKCIHHQSHDTLWWVHISVYIISHMIRYVEFYHQSLDMFSLVPVSVYIIIHILCYCNFYIIDYMIQHSELLDCVYIIDHMICNTECMLVFIY